MKIIAIALFALFSLAACESETVDRIDVQCSAAIDQGYIGEDEYLECVDSYTRLADRGAEDRNSEPEIGR